MVGSVKMQVGEGGVARLILLRIRTVMIYLQMRFGLTMSIPCLGC